MALTATAFAGKVPVGLNFIASKEEQNHMLEICNVRSILTSKVFIEKAGIPYDKRMVFIESIKEKIPKKEKTLMYLTCKFRSKQTLIKKYATDDDADKNAIIVFTSGTEANPKGVPLTNYNICSSIQNFTTVFDPISEDIFLGSLPFFHVFGFVVCLWLPLIMGRGVAFHPNPTDYEKLGKLIQKKKVTIILGTNTLYRGFIKKWKKEQATSVRLAFAGAEKLQENVRNNFYNKFGITIFEGYGTTESSACVSANSPKEYMHGSVGKLLPDIKCRIVNTDTYEEVQPGEEGLILIQGPSIMKGYYKSPELMEKAFYNGFYITGDIGRLQNGFLYITDRLKRFAKIGGEMVALSPIENKLDHLLDEHTEDENRNCAIVAIPDEQKGEQVVAFVACPNPDKQSLNTSLDALGVTKLSQPSHYIHINSIPLLPSGKVDYKKIKQLATEYLS